MSEGLVGVADGAHVRPDKLAGAIARRRLVPQMTLQGLSCARRSGATIYAQGEPAEFIYQVVAGVVRTASQHRDGRRIIHGFHLPGEIFGLERDKVHHCSAEAVGQARLVQCPAGRLNALTDDDKDAARELRMSLLASRDRTDERFMYIMHGTAFERLSYFLIDLAWRTQAGRRIDLPMSRYDIADYLGLSSETVSRTFTVLRRRGLISTNGRQVWLLSNEILRIGDDFHISGDGPPGSLTLP